MATAHRSSNSQCAICGRSGTQGLCAYHREGTERLRKHFSVWMARTGMSWEEYLRAVKDNELAGEWVKESAAFLLEIKGQQGPPA